MKKCKKGFTLIEILIALAILCIMVTPILSLSLGSVKTNQGSLEKLKSKDIAQNYMEFIKSQDVSLKDIEDLIKGKSLSSLPKKKDGFDIEVFIETSDKSEKSDFSNINNLSYQIKVETDSKNNLIKIYGKDDSLIYALAKSSGESLVITNHEDKINFQIKDNNAQSISVSKSTLINRSTKDVAILFQNKNKQSLNVEGINTIEDENLIFYFDNHNYKECNLTYSEGKIKVCNNIDSSDNSGKKQTKLYKVKINVKKKGNLIQTLEGYKVF